MSTCDENTSKLPSGVLTLMELFSMPFAPATILHFEVAISRLDSKICSRFNGLPGKPKHKRDGWGGGGATEKRNYCNYVP